MLVSRIRCRWQTTRRLCLRRNRGRPAIALLTAVNRLGEPHREVITRKYFDRLTIEEVAGQLGIPAGTVRSRLSRAYSELREMLTDES